jgi:putative oxidoreductase
MVNDRQSVIHHCGSKWHRRFFMERFLGKYSPYLYTTLRILAGLMFAMHGSQKLFAWPGGKAAVPFASLMGVAGLVELIGGLMIALGLLTRYAAFIASGQMAVAYFKAHAPQGALPLLNRGELAVLYCFLFLYIAAQGAGGWSLDAMLRRKR